MSDQHATIIVRGSDFQPSASGNRGSVPGAEYPAPYGGLPERSQDLEGQLLARIKELQRNPSHAHYNKVIQRNKRLTVWTDEKDTKGKGPIQYYDYTCTQTNKKLDYRFYPDGSSQSRGYIVAIGGAFEAPVILGKAPGRPQGIQTPWYGIHRGFAGMDEDVVKTPPQLSLQQNQQGSRAQHHDVYPDVAGAAGAVGVSSPDASKQTSLFSGTVEHDATEDGNPAHPGFRAVTRSSANHPSGAHAHGVELPPEIPSTLHSDLTAPSSAASHDAGYSDPIVASSSRRVPSTTGAQTRPSPPQHKHEPGVEQPTATPILRFVHHETGKERTRPWSECQPAEVFGLQALTAEVLGTRNDRGPLSIECKVAGGGSLAGMRLLLHDRDDWPAFEDLVRGALGSCRGGQQLEVIISRTV